MSQVPEAVHLTTPSQCSGRLNCTRMVKTLPGVPAEPGAIQYMRGRLHDCDIGSANSHKGTARADERGGGGEGGHTVRAAVLDVSAVHVQEGRHGADDARAVFADHRQHARLQRVLALERQGGQHSGCYRRRQLGRWFLAPCRGIRGRRRRSCHLGPPSAPRVGLRRRPLERSPVFPGTRNRSKPRGPADRDGAVGTEAGSRRRCESKPEGQADTQG